MGNRPMASLAVLLFFLVDFITSQGTSPYGTYNAPYYQQAQANGTVSEYINYRYQGCYNHNVGGNGIYVLFENEFGGGNAGIISYETCGLACWGGSDYRDGEGRPRRYSNFIYMGITGGNACWCGNSTITSLVTNATNSCFYPSNTSIPRHRYCRGNGTEDCGGDTAGVVFLRTDIGGNCATNSSGSLDHACFETSFTNRTLSPFINYSGGFNYSAVMLSGDRNVVPDPTSSGGYSPNYKQNNGTFLSPFRTFQGTTPNGYQNETYEVMDYRYLGCYNTSTTVNANSATGSNVLQYNTGLGSFDQNSCARQCWTDTPTIYRQWNYMAVAQGGVNGTRCYCGNFILTNQTDESLCFGPQSATACTTNSTQLCGSPNAALVFGRADIYLTCDAASSTVNTTNDHDCFEVINVNRTIDNGCETNITKCGVYQNNCKSCLFDLCRPKVSAIALQTVSPKVWYVSQRICFLPGEGFAPSRGAGCQ